MNHFVVCIRPQPQLTAGTHTHTNTNTGQSAEHITPLQPNIHTYIYAGFRFLILRCLCAKAGSIAPAAARAHSGRRRRRRREEEAHRVYGWRGGAASLRRADTAKVCSNVGLVAVDGVFECSVAVAATQGVSGRLRARQGLRHLSLAATSAFDATSKRHVSTRPL
jgi:hypothetical protein